MTLTRFKDEIPVWRKETEMGETIPFIVKQFVSQIRRLNASRRSSLSSPLPTENAQDEILVFGRWSYIWGKKLTAGASKDAGIF